MRNKLNLLLALLTLLGQLPLQAQVERSFAGIDSLSYQACLDSNWREVRRLTTEGFSLGYDYYFLRMRAGVAELGLNRPLKAENHFKKALAFSSQDPYATAYRYLALVASGHFAEARLVADSIPQDTRERFQIPAPRPITSAFVEPGYMFAARADDMKSTLGTAVSQYGSLDALIVAVTQARMVWEIGHVFQQRPSLRHMGF
ncbi:MAG: hypothetical protein R6V75_02195, partial [Bacteroidales bacterium]